MDHTGATTRVRRNLILLGAVAITALSVLAVTQSEAAKKADCTAIGTAGRDIMTGGPGRQVICTKGAGDYGHGQNGNDVLRGGGKNDTLIGGKGADHVEGKGGPDQLFAVDGIQGNDVVKGGDGSDHCYADPGDKVKGCEFISRGASMAESQALQEEFGGVMVLAEEQISTSPTPTTTIPVTGCVSGPPQPEPFCGSPSP